MSLAAWAQRKGGKLAGAFRKVDGLEPAGGDRSYHPFQDQVGRREWRDVPDYERKVAEALRGKEVERVPLDDLTMTQETVNPDQVKHYVAAKDPPPAKVVVMGGKKLLYDGHHRATADWAKGLSYVEARVGELKEADGDRSPSGAPSEGA